MLPGWPLTVDDLPLPEGIVLREDTHFIYVLRDGLPVALLSTGISRVGLEFAVQLVTVTRKEIH